MRWRIRSSVRCASFPASTRRSRRARRTRFPPTPSSTRIRRRPEPALTFEFLEGEACSDDSTPPCPTPTSRAASRMSPASRRRGSRRAMHVGAIAPPGRRRRSHDDAIHRGPMRRAFDSARGGARGNRGGVPTVSAQQPQPRPPAFRTDADLVLVDAVVVDKPANRFRSDGRGFRRARRRRAPDHRVVQAVHTPADAASAAARPPLDGLLDQRRRRRAGGSRIVRFRRCAPDAGGRGPIEAGDGGVLDRETRAGDLVSIVALAARSAGTRACPTGAPS